MCGIRVLENMSEIKQDLVDKEKIIEVENFIPLASDGYRASPISLFLDVEDYLIITELSYAYGIEEKEDSQGNIKEIETIKPLLLICKYNKNAKEKFYEVKILKKEDKLEVGNLNITLIQNSISKVGIPTLMKYLTLETIYTELDNKEVDIREIYEVLKKEYQKYIFHNNKNFYSFLSVYTIATYFRELFSAFPILYFYGTFGSGKTRVLQTLQCFCHRAFLWGFETEATTFRFADAIRGTLLIDNKIFRDSKELLNYLLGYKKDSLIPRLYKSKSLRKETFEIEFYSPSVAYVLNSTDSPDKFSSYLLEQFISRCISINLVKGEPMRKQDPIISHFDEIRDKLYRLRFQIFEKVLHILNNVSAKLSLEGRLRELWLPIFTISSVIGEEVFNEMKEYQKQLYESIEENLYKREKIIIQAIELLPIEEDFYRFTTTELREKIKEFLVNSCENEFEREEKEGEFTRYWTLKSIGSLLKNSGLLRKSVRENEKFNKKYIISTGELKKLKEKYFENVDRLDRLDRLSEYKEENQTSNFKENSQNTQDFEAENTSICSNNLSKVSKVSTNNVELKSKQRIIYIKDLYN